MADKRQDGSNRGMPTLSLHGAPSSHRTSPSHRTSSSYRTSSSRKSGSSAALVVATQKAKAEEARVRLEYIRQEADMLRQQAEMEARHQKERTELAIDLKVLETQRELKEAEAGLEALNESIENESEKFSGNLELDDEMLNVKQERTEQYVKDMQNIDREPMNSRNSEPMNNRNPEPDSKPEPDSTAKELTKYIMKKDMIMSKFYKFNDKPERYCMWKASFKNIITEMDLAASEELDLMCRWLGPQSSGQACSLRAANCGREASAIDKIWERLDCRYGAPELIVQSLQERLSSFTKLTTKDSEKLYELSDILNEIDSLKQDEQYKAALAYLDSSAGVNPIVSQLPSFMQGKWTDRAMKYKKDHSVLFPPFAVFTEFVTNMASRANDPSFRFDTPISKPPWNNAVRKQEQATAYRNTVSARKTCVIHGETAKHTLKECRTFQMKPIAEKKEIIKQNGICFKCCDGKHLAKDCTVDVTCEKCGSTRHCTEFHRDRSYGGEPTNTRVTTACTEVCGDVGFQGKSCAKTVLVNIYPEGKPHRALKTYAMIDDQSNRTLARTEFFQHFNENCEEIEYILSSCSGKVSTSGRRAQSYVIESIDGNTTVKCPSVIECNGIPNDRHEIPTPTVARQYEHLKGIEHLIPEYDPQAEILLLIGRDMISAHHVLDQRLGSDNEPYAQRLKLGWVIVGETCLQMVHMTETISVKKTYIYNDGYETVLKPCPNSFQLTSKPIDIFERTPDDEDPGLSREDRDFLKIMDKEFTKSPDGNWSAPLPFPKGRPRLPDNYQQARNSAQSLAGSLKRDPVKEGHYVPTEANPADQATRPLKAGDLMSSKWLKGPEVFLDSCESSNKATYALVEPDTDKEIRPEVKVCKMSVVESRLGNDRFKRFSTWIGLTSAISRLKQKASVYHQDDAKNSRNSLDFQKEAELLVLREVQNEIYPSEIDCLKGGQPLPRNSSLLALSPVLDKNGLLRIGGRIKNAEIATVEKNPIIIPGKHHIATLLVGHFHETIRHQGRHLTEGAIRSAGYWVIGGKRLINSVLRAGVKCKRLRGKFEQQKMAELPSDRLTQCPPFTYVGVDTFGPWSVTSRRTRVGSACSKQWAIMFSCLVTRGIHIEVVEELSSSSFINALRRFISLRGPVKEFRSDRGTNFVGATDDLGISGQSVPWRLCFLVQMD